MIYSLSREACQRLRQSLNILLREDKINEMGHLILVYMISIISVIAFTYLTVTGVMGAITNTTAKVNATPNTTLHKNGASKDFLTPYYKGVAYLNEGNYTRLFHILIKLSPLILIIL